MLFVAVVILLVRVIKIITLVLVLRHSIESCCVTLILLKSLAINEIVLYQEISLHIAIHKVGFWIGLSTPEGIFSFFFFFRWMLQYYGTFFLKMLDEQILLTLLNRF